MCPLRPGYLRSLPRSHSQAARLRPLGTRVRGRPDVADIFPGRDAISRLVGAVLAGQKDEWAESRRYMGLEILAACRKAGNNTLVGPIADRGHSCLTGNRSRGSHSYTIFRDVAFAARTALFRASRAQITHLKPECLRIRGIIRNFPSRCSSRPVTCGDVSRSAPSQRVFK